MKTSLNRHAILMFHFFFLFLHFIVLCAKIMNKIEFANLKINFEKFQFAYDGFSIGFHSALFKLVQN